MPANIKGWHRIILWLVVFKIGYLATICLAVRLWANLDEERFAEINARWFHAASPESPVFVSHLSTWDGAHYLYSSEQGYEKGMPSCAFYPLWPLTIRWFSALTGDSDLTIGMVLANIFSLAAWVIFYQI